MHLRELTRVVLTLLVARVAAQLCAWPHPIAWMLGALLATAMASVLGAGCAFGFGLLLASATGLHPATPIFQWLDRRKKTA